MPYREDCWSEGETSALVDAWGDRYIELNRGNLRQKDWQEVADSVNSRRGAGRRPPRTDIQCKNRIDTLKKKYKVEKARITSGGAESQWPFFSRLDALVGSASAPAAKGTPLPAAAAVRSAEPREKRQAASEFPVDNPFFRRAAAAAAAAAEDDDDEEEEEVEGSDSLSRSSSKLGRGLKRGRDLREGGGVKAEADDGAGKAADGVC
ncbi:hypothetical protein MUK42_08311 [Musa troglodytarum]|uniref:Myb/SANT-like DNA-binding domain-containing protein n=1 Tax=Musa troglodytarum TaxID=320322 RepID=A0A9E7E9E6_9LILI|nr:hypothetical protein MUK42_08311 [Musa troglodytarum]